MNTGGRLVIAMLKEKGTVLKPSNNYPDTAEIPPAVLIEGAI